MPKRFKSSPEVIELAREWMQKTKASFNDFKNDTPENRIIRDSLTHEWDGPSWSDMDGETKRGMLESALTEFVWDIDPADEGPLIDEFLNEEKRQLFAEWRHDYGLRHWSAASGIRTKARGSSRSRRPLTQTQQQVTQEQGDVDVYSARIASAAIAAHDPDRGVSVDFSTWAPPSMSCPIRPHFLTFTIPLSASPKVQACRPSLPPRRGMGRC